MCWSFPLVCLPPPLFYSADIFTRPVLVAICEISIKVYIQKHNLVFIFYNFYHSLWEALGNKYRWRWRVCQILYYILLRSWSLVITVLCCFLLLWLCVQNSALTYCNRSNLEKNMQSYSLTKSKTLIIVALSIFSNVAQGLETYLTA